MSTDRDEIRTAFFANKPKVEPVKLASGHSVEVRAPLVGEQIILSQIEEADKRILRMFTNNVFVPGTDEKVFEVEDLDVLKQQPTGGDYSKIMDAISRVMDLKLATDAAAKNSAPTPA